MAETSELTELFYEAAFLAERWPDVLAELIAAGAGRSGAIMLFEEARPVEFIASGASEEPIRDYVMDNAVLRDRRLGYFSTHPFTGFVIAEDYFPADLLDEEFPYRRLRAMGVSEQLGTILPLPTGEMAVAVLERYGDETFSPADMELFNGLHPHLARAMTMAARMGLERARSMLRTLEALALPAALVSAHGAVLDSNQRFDAVEGVFTPRAFGGLALSTGGAANALLADAIHAMAAGGAAGARSIALPGRAGQAPAVLHVLPVVGAAHDLFGRAAAVLVLTEVRASALVPSASLLTGLFDLTPAETRLVLALARGEALVDHARTEGVGLATVRTHLSHVFAKTGTGQQSQLVALVKSVAGSAPPEAD